MGIIPPMISVVVEAMVMPLAVRADSRLSAMGGDMNKNHQKYNIFGLSSMVCQLDRKLILVEPVTPFGHRAERADQSTTMSAAMVFRLLRCLSSEVSLGSFFRSSPFDKRVVGSRGEKAIKRNHM